MIPIALQQEDEDQAFQPLQKLISSCPTIREDVKIILEEFLVRQEIYNTAEIGENILPCFEEYLDLCGIRARAKRSLCKNAIKKLKTYDLTVQYQGLIKDIMECGLERPIRNKLIEFLIRNQVKSVSEISYELRDQYERTLKMPEQNLLTYVKGMDRVKLQDIKRHESLHVIPKRLLDFKEQKLFLLYYPDYEIANSFYYTRDKHELVWDFSIEAPYILKKQIFHMLMYVINNEPACNMRRVRFLLPLKWFYEFCVQNGIEDIEQLGLYQVEAFRNIVAKKVVNVDTAMQIVDNIRKRLFLDAKETNWRANVWYTERFHLPEERMNPSNPILRLRFYGITNKENRRLVQDYIQYQIGLTDRALSDIRHKYYFVVQFVKAIEESGKRVIDLTAEDMEHYFRGLDEEDLLPDTYNVKLICIYQFFRFLKIRGWISDIPFLVEYYLKKTFPIHHDRCVPEDTVKMILQNLYQFPMALRLMFLNLWCLGLRINEVCTLRGNAYYWNNNAGWVKVYQYKMRSEKAIPIPSVLYRVMTDYIKRNHIGPNEFIFKSAKGRAYHTGTFNKQMIDQLNAIGISCDEYEFKSHDYRHTVATFLYAHGASIQTARDYLGHENEQMTLQYLDYMPTKVRNANEEYFSNPENNLAASLKKGGYHGKPART